MFDSNLYMRFPKDEDNFYEIKNSKLTVNIKWSKNTKEDFANLAQNYFDCGYYLAKNIVQKKDNVKSDMWFLPCIYLLRHSLELILKSLVCKNYKRKDWQSTFKGTKHNLYLLYNKNLEYIGKYLKDIEKEWLKTYLWNLELIDEKSDLFRFPFEDHFLIKYEKKYINIFDTINNILVAYSLLKKCLLEDEAPSKYFNIIRSNEFLIIAEHGIGNCDLYDSLSTDNFYKQIRGYNEAATFLLYECKEIEKEKLAYPLLFLQRNLIELSLKRLFTTKLYNSNTYVFNSKKKSHLIYKDLWKNIKPIAQKYYKDDKLLQILDDKLKNLSEIDKNGDMFRYPVSYSLEYRFNDLKIDLENIYVFTTSIFNFLDNCYFNFNLMSEYQYYY